MVLYLLSFYFCVYFLVVFTLPQYNITMSDRSQMDMKDKLNMFPLYYRFFNSVLHSLSITVLHLEPTTAWCSPQDGSVAPVTKIPATIPL